MNWSKYRLSIYIVFIVAWNFSWLRRECLKNVLTFFNQNDQDNVSLVVFGTLFVACYLVFRFLIICVVVKFSFWLQITETSCFIRDIDNDRSQSLRDLWSVKIEPIYQIQVYVLEFQLRLWLLIDYSNLSE